MSMITVERYRTVSLIFLISSLATDKEWKWAIFFMFGIIFAIGGFLKEEDV